MGIRDILTCTSVALTFDDGAVLACAEHMSVVGADDDTRDGQLVAPQDSDVSCFRLLDLRGRQNNLIIGCPSFLEIHFIHF